ncbi:type II toxin-antitoxin system RelE/ParE family toxin [Flavobacterium sp. DG2-3]|uniref:type II toxin-antitoxin system RelE/ParE family toxin n=1 Tax=Flavobacterium sp. DG2-3 TaxID=3068317 RepID=UPI00273F5EC5|nr:type II toxin-antitoxin system RelE/ParE family toxin [Flavobacterium sp. DG2-3]MDP5199510.1 type II toxin-antitoxin system RelE/ParE family toxin [Flavobacterium sp. DG2-3]
MGLKIFWTDFAKKELRNIFDYYKREASLNVARNLVSGITKETVKLISHLEIGQEEELLINNPNGIRYLIYKNYKIIYWINVEKNTIEILDVFDTRQNPEKIYRNK